MQLSCCLFIPDSIDPSTFPTNLLSEGGPGLLSGSLSSGTPAGCAGCRALIVLREGDCAFFCQCHPKRLRLSFNSVRILCHRFGTGKWVCIRDHYKVLKNNGRTNVSLR